MSKVRSWVTIEGYPDYEVSNKGEVRSKDRTLVVDGHERNYCSRLLRINVCSRGFCNVTLSVGGRRVSRRVHKLVADAFIPKVVDKPQVVHVNGDKSNNSVKNLRRVIHIGGDYFIA